MLIGVAITFLAAIFCILEYAHLTWQVGSVKEDTSGIYDRHFVFISEDSNDDFWDEIYGEVSSMGKEENVYVERLKDSLNVEYSTVDLLRVAVNSSVDGIMINAIDTPEVEDLIDKAVSKGICVVTMREDVENSARQCFVGINNYDLGVQYGKQILKARNLDEIRKSRIGVLMDASASESSQNLISFAIKDAISAELEEGEEAPEVEIIKIQNQDTFSAEEDIHDIFVDRDNLPEILVCLNNVYTQCCYQAAVDFNRVGDVTIVGYYASDATLEAVEKNIIFSTIRMNTQKMAQSCLKALNEYCTYGYTNSYFPIETDIIGHAEAVKIMQERETDESGKKME